ncbi:MAG: hypothetical protein KDA36_09190 [Planctomycetaceae bacterium]|nr:hypothetical protein [Planctomycetaceae bacterium]
MAGCIGFDIGGANIKAAHSEGLAQSDGAAYSIPFPLWQSPEKLSGELQRLLDRLPAADSLAVTMTGELADCYATKADGIAHILSAMQSIADSRPIHVWSTAGEFVTVEQASEKPLSVAAANWYAVATWWGQTKQVESGLLIDIGSTTTDMIPIRNRKPATQGLTDVTRLHAGELFYTGVSRTPICAVVHQVPFRGEMVPVAAEWFSTTLDIALLLDEIPDAPEDCDTANHRPATRDGAWDRLARQICCDRTECPIEEAVGIAQYVREQQLAQLHFSLEKVLARHSNVAFSEVLLSGSGRDLARRMLSNFPVLNDASIIDLGEILNPSLASAACAYAVAKLCESG